MANPLDHTPETKGQLLELQAVLFLDAPNNFFRLPDFPLEEQRNLEGTIADMRRGIEHLYKKPIHADARRRMHKLLDKMHAEFKANLVSEGRATSLDFADLVRVTKRQITSTRARSVSLG